MLVPGPAKKVTIHLNEDTSSSTDFLYSEVFHFLLDRGVSGANLIRPAAGFGTHRKIHVRESEHRPIRIEFVESVEKFYEILPDLLNLVTDGLVEAQDTTIYKAATKRGRTI